MNGGERVSELDLPAVVGLGGKSVAIAIGALGVLRFIKWLTVLVFQRIDVGDKRLALRLKHVEEELGAYREVALLMIGVVANIEPDNPALATAASILRNIPPRPTLNLEELVERLAAMPGTKKGGAQ